jgi:DNA polymerase III sliding clamp (beta) subunit (PCNA family)
MFLSKKALQVIEAAPKMEGRYALQGVRVEPDGSCVATDGHRLAIYRPKPAVAPAVEDWPPAGGAAEGVLDEAVVVSREAVKGLISSFPRASAVKGLPHLSEYAAVDVEATASNGALTATVTDLSNPRTLRLCKLEGSFPRYENVVPKAAEQTSEIGLSVDYLASLCRLAKRQGIETLALSVRAGVDPATEREKAPDCPVVFRGETEDGALTYVLMPMHLS